MLKSLVNARTYCKEDVAKIAGYREALADSSQGRTWKLIDGRRVYFKDEEKLN